MSDGDVVKRVRDLYEAMSKSQQKVAEFFITSEEALYLSAARIAEILEVSHSTVVRTAQAIGFEGFPDLQAALQEKAFGRTTTAAAYELGKRQLGKDGQPIHDPATLLRRLMLSDANAIQNLADEIHGEDFAVSVERLIAAQGVYVIGLRSSAPVARSFAMALRQLRPNCTLLEPGTGDLVDQIFDITEQDTLFAICFGRYATVTLRCMDFARSVGAHVIAITDSPLSPAARRANVSFVVKSGVWFHGASAALLSLLNAFISAMMVQQPELTKQRLEKIGTTLKYFDVFDSGDDAPPLREDE
ncbi:MAG: MurR/RpiR family transcriptional regulator [Chloroflexi bacterium]|nr:MurR/RpiR family transcriptional regulator [Chloroflexota bacterium]